ncbi:hypothetical protein V6N13_133421 [Hibiscus sabdariffa]
MERLKS